MGLTLGMPKLLWERRALTPNRFMPGRRDRESGKHRPNCQLLLPDNYWVAKVRELRKAVAGRHGYWMKVGGLQINVALAADPPPPKREAPPPDQRNGRLASASGAKRPKSPTGFTHTS